MTKALILILFIFAGIVSISGFPTGAVAALTLGVLLLLSVYFLRRSFNDDEEQEFVLNLFLSALLIRAVLAFVIYIFHLEKYFGPDAFGYNSFGVILADCWWTTDMCPELVRDNWGMAYFVGGVYSLTGPNPLAVQFVSAICGAISVILVYQLAKEIYVNSRVAKYAAYLIAFFPAMFIWTSQMLKDGFILFFLVLVVFSVSRLQRHLSYKFLIALVVSLFCILTLRFYIFYMLVVAAIGGLFLGANLSVSSLVKRSIVFSIAASVFLFLGIQKISDKQLDTVSLQRLQNIRSYSSNAAIANSVIEIEADVSTASGALSAIPAGFVTILFAPFPWQMKSVTQFLIFPEMLVWWGMFPFMIIGIKYTIRNRLRESITYVFFSLMLLIGYSLYQGNLGTIYRQRTQVQVFLLVFVAVGYVVHMERRENRRAMEEAEIQRYRRIGVTN